MLYFKYLAFRITAGMTLETAFFIGEQGAAIRALAGQVLGEVEFLYLRLFAGDVLFQDAGNGIGTGEDRFTFFPGDGGTADTA